MDNNGPFLLTSNLMHSGVYKAKKWQNAKPILQMKEVALAPFASGRSNGSHSRCSSFTIHDRCQMNEEVGQQQSTVRVKKGFT